MKDIFLVDMDETLLDFRAAERENLGAALAFSGIAADGGILARFHEINDSLWKALERGEMTRERLKTERFRLLFAEYDFPADAAAAARFYWQNFPEVCFPFGGSLGFLRALKGRGRVYIVTNGGAEIQKRHLEKAGFLPYLDGAFISEEIGADKPSAAFAEYAAAHIGGFARERAVWIGDSLTSDGKCAADFGIDFILFTPREDPPVGYPGPFARSYAEVLGLLG